MFEHFDASEADRVPNTPGLYLFYLQPVTPAKIGLRGAPASHTPDQCSRARSVMVDRLRRAMQVLHAASLSGKLIQDSKAEHIAASYQLSGTRLVNQSLLDLVAQIPLDQVHWMATNMRKLASMLQPIYIGITEKQTLRQRYDQHFSAFESDRENLKGFGARVRDSGFYWDDLLYVCIPIPVADVPPNNLRTLERLAQSLGRPAFSIA